MSSSPSKSLSLQNLLKTGFTPTLKTSNKFLTLLFHTHRFRYLLHFFSQMTSNHLTPNSKTHSILSAALIMTRHPQSHQFIPHFLKTGLSPQKGIWDSLIQSLCSSEQTPRRALEVLLDYLKFPGVSPSRSTFSSLIHSFSSLGDMDGAMQVLELMTGENFGHPFDNFVCTSIISGFCKIGKPEIALDFYDGVEKLGVLSCPNVVTYTCIVSALCKEGRVKEVCDLVHKMDSEGVVLDAVFYSSWICGCFEDKVLEEVFRKHKEMLGRGIKPDIVSYTILIDGFSKEGNVEKAVGFLNQMKNDGLQPNLVTYTAIMRGFCKKGKLEEALCMFKKVEDLGIKVDEVTYSTIIDGLCRIQEFDRVFLLLDEMEEKDINIGIITYNTVINGLCKVGRTSEADEISNSILSDNFTFSTLLHGYVQENNATGILETKRRVDEADIDMDIVMCNVLIKALFLVGAFEDAYMIFKGIPDMGLVADSVTYSTMVNGYCKNGRIDKALEIFDAYRGSSSVASVHCYNYIVHALCENNMVDMAIDVFTELIGKALVPERATYMVLLRSIFNEMKGEGVMQFVNGFEKSEPQRFHFMCNDAILFLCKKGCLETALDLYMVLRKKGLGVTCKCYYSILEGLLSDGSKLLLPIVLNACIKECGYSAGRINKIILTYLCEKDVTKASRLLEKMKERHLFVTIPISALKRLIKQGSALDAYKLLNISGKNTSSDVVAYSIVIDGLCKEGHLHKALDLCATMKKRGIVPNIVTYNSVINGLCQQGCLIEALRIFDSLEKISSTPNEITYGTLISALSKEGYLQNAKELFEKMVLNGLTPQTHVYNSLIDGYCKFGLLDEAFKLLITLEKNWYKPDAFTVSSLINGFCRKGDMEAALTFYFEYKRKEILPDFFGYVCLTKGLCVKGRMEEARSILREMLQNHSIIELINTARSEIGTESLASVLVSLCDQGNIDQAITVLSEIASDAFSTRKRYHGATDRRNLNDWETSTIDTSKSLYPKTGRFSTRYSEMSKASSELKDSASSSRKPVAYDLDSYYFRIASLCSEGKLDQANQVAKQMLNA